MNEPVYHDDADDEGKSVRQFGGGKVVAASREMRDALALASRAADDDRSSVLLLGESGTGKGLLAEEIHAASPRSNAPFITMNCGAPNPNLIEDELFGHERGGFTGAVAHKPGVFEQANRGTLFLDEIGDLPLELQVKVFRLLDKRMVRRMGSAREIPVDVRIISATNLDLEAEIRNGTFRKELYFRINVVRIVIPPLRERVEDILPLAAHFLARFAEEKGRPILGMTAEVEAILQNYSWPGNARELQNAIEHAMVMEKSARINAESLPDSITRDAGVPATARERGQTTPSDSLGTKLGPTRLSIDAPSKSEIEAALGRTSGNATRAAERLGLSRDQLQRRLIYHRIDLRSFKKRKD